MDAIRAWAIPDSGATSHFLTTAAPMTNMHPTSKPIISRLPNGKRVHSTHMCTLNITALPASAHPRPGFPLPNLRRHPMQCRQCRLHQDWMHNHVSRQVILCSSKCTRTGLWIIPLSRTPPLSANKNLANLLPTVIAANVDATSSAGEYARYIHQDLCSPPATTLIQAF